MTKETQRIILASILITLVAYFYPNFWINNNNVTNNGDFGIRTEEGNTFVDNIINNNGIVNVFKSIIDIFFHPPTSPLINFSAEKPFLN